MHIPEVLMTAVGTVVRHLCPLRPKCYVVEVEERKQVQVHNDVSVKRGEDIRSEYLLLLGEL